MLVNFRAIWSILLPFGIFYSHLVHFVVFLVYFPRFGMLCQDKSGNPVAGTDAHIGTCDAPDVLGIPDPERSVGRSRVQLVVDHRHAVDGAFVTLASKSVKIVL
jgi:hypothetical protein